MGHFACLWTFGDLINLYILSEWMFFWRSDVTRIFSHVQLKSNATGLKNAKNRHTDMERWKISLLLFSLSLSWIIIVTISISTIIIIIIMILMLLFVFFLKTYYHHHKRLLLITIYHHHYYHCYCYCYFYYHVAFITIAIIHRDIYL